MPSQKKSYTRNIINPPLEVILGNNARNKTRKPVKNFLTSSSGLFDWKRGEAEVWLDNTEVGEECLGLLIGDAWVNDNIIAWHPIDWGGDAKEAISIPARGESRLLVQHTDSCHQSGESQQPSRPQRCSFQWRLGMTG